MRLNQASDFALRLVMQCAMQPDVIHKIDDVVRQQSFSKGHVMKLVSLLVRAGILSSVRGRGGGYRLGREAGEIRVGDVVRAVEADFHVVECLKPDEGKDCGCCYLPACRVKTLMGRAVSAFMAVLDDMTIEQVVRSMPLPVAFEPADPA